MSNVSKELSEYVHVGSSSSLLHIGYASVRYTYRVYPHRLSPRFSAYLHAARSPGGITLGRVQGELAVVDFTALCGNWPRAQA